jgi:hypothetical protein
LEREVGTGKAALPLNVMFEAVCVDTAARKPDSVKPHPQFATLLRVDGCFYPSKA